MKSKLFAFLLMIFALPTWAKDIPSEFQGKWAGLYDRPANDKQVKLLCALRFQDKPISDMTLQKANLSEDSGFFIQIDKQSFELSGWEYYEKFKPLKYTTHSPNKITGTARIEDETDPEQGLMIRQGNFALFLNKQILTRKFLDYAPDDSGKKIWQTQTFRRCS